MVHHNNFSFVIPIPIEIFLHIISTLATYILMHTGAALQFECALVLWTFLVFVFVSFFLLHIDKIVFWI